MPVRWRRRPAAASAAVAAGADPDFSCAGELEPADRPAIRGKCALGWVCRPPLWVWWSSLVGGSISLSGLCLLGSSVRGGALGFVDTRNRTFCFLGSLHVCLSSRYLRPVWECARGWCLRGVRFPRRALASAAAAARARRTIGRAFSVFVCGLRAVPPPLGVRCALFSVFVGVGRFSGVNKIGRLFGGASPSGFAFGLRLRASPSGPPEATTRLMTHGRCPGSFSDSPKNTHGTSRSYLPRNTAVRRFGAFPALLVAIHLPSRQKQNEPRHSHGTAEPQSRGAAEPRSRGAAMPRCRGAAEPRSCGAAEPRGHLPKNAVATKMTPGHRSGVERHQCAACSRRAVLMLAIGFSLCGTTKIIRN